MGLPLGMVLALAVVRGRARRRAAEQAAEVSAGFPDALMRMAGHLRAGQSLAQAVEGVATSGSGALERCLARVLADYRAGVPLIQALGKLEGEFPGQATSQFQQVLDVYRLSGGDLAEVLDNAAAALAEQNTLLGELEAKTAEAQLSARILLALPVALGSYFWFTNPEMLRPLWETSTGRLGLLYGSVSWVVGQQLMDRLIAEVRAERR
jgi:tight adherence protein B